MNNTLKSAIPVALISAVLVALVFAGYSFWLQEKLNESAAKQRTEMDAMQTAYNEQLMKFSEKIVARVDATQKTLDAAIQARNTDLFLTEEENRKVETEKVNALADAVMVRLNTVIPTPEDQERGYNTVTQKVHDRLNPILSEIARTGNLTRSDVEFYSSQITGLIDGVLKEQMAEKQQLNNNLLTTTAIAQDAMRISQEMAALYVASLKDQGVVSRILSLPVRVVQDVSTGSIIGSSDRKKAEERVFMELDQLEKRLAGVGAAMPGNQAPVQQKFEVTETPAAPVRAKPTPPNTSN